MIDIGYFVSAYINEGTREIILAQTVSQQPTLQVGAAQVRVVTCEIKNIKTCPEVTVILRIIFNITLALAAKIIYTKKTAI